MTPFTLIIRVLCCQILVCAVAGCAPYYYDDAGYEVTNGAYDDRNYDGSLYDQRSRDGNFPIRWSERRAALLPESTAPAARAPEPRVAIARPPIVTPPPPARGAQPANLLPADPSSPLESTTDPFMVAGLSEREVEATFGKPKEQSEQGPRRIWTYHQAGCTLQVVLFLDITRNGYYALDHKVVAADGSTRSVRECVRDVRNARRD